jgi:hypothetical protein
VEPKPESAHKRTPRQAKAAAVTAIDSRRLRIAEG